MDAGGDGGSGEGAGVGVSVGGRWAQARERARARVSRRGRMGVMVWGVYHGGVRADLEEEDNACR